MEKKNNGFFLGIVGAFLGALIGTIPWILLYVYANMIYSLLALFVAMAALKGYELFKGKIDKKLPYIIAIVSVIAITIATLVIIPNLLVFKEVGTMSFANFRLLYSTSEFTKAILGDYALSLLFTFLGISGVISSIKKQVNNGHEKIDLNYNENKISDEVREKIKNIFVKYNALDKHNAISKEILWRETEENENAINYLISQEYIKVHKGNYYYSVKAENVRKKNFKKWIIIILVILAMFAIGIFANSQDTNETNNDKTQEIEKEVSFTNLEDYQEYDNDEGTGWYYVPKKDLSWNSGSILVTYDESSEPWGDLATIKQSFIESFSADNYVIKSTSDYINDKGNQVLVFVIEFEAYEEIVHYIFKDKKFAIIDGINYYDTKNSTIANDTEIIAKSFDWK